MGMFYVSLVFSCIFLSLTIWVAMRAGPGWVGLLAPPLIFVSLLVGSEALVAQCVLTAIAAVACAAAKARRGVMVGLSISMLVLAYGYTWLRIGQSLQAVEELRDVVPFESMQPRLAYEDRLKSNDGVIPPPTITFEVSARLAGYEMDYANGRGNALRRLHSDYFDKFIVADGFGDVRMGGISRGIVRLPESIVVPQPAPSDGTCRGPDAEESAVELMPQPFDDLLLTAHDGAYANFLDPWRMGYVESRERVSGFGPHQFSEVPSVEHDDWVVSRVELISLLKHEEPVAYVSENLPSMEELVDAPTRPLNDFERAAVDLLRTDSDLEFRYGTNRIDMVGSVRAAESCTACHAVPRGHLLGAFSYRLDRATPLRLAESDDEP